MGSDIIRRIEADLGVPDLATKLAALPASDLQSLQLTIQGLRGRSMTEARIMERATAPLLLPSSADARLLNGFDRIAFATASAFDALDLSPVNPLGTSYVLGGIDPNNLLSALRSTEVLGDSTPALALESARRRKKDRSKEVRLCASHRTLRLQPFDQPGFTPHFRLFAMVSAGRDRGSEAFEAQHLYEHIRFYLSLFRALNAEGFSINRPVVELTDLARTEQLLLGAGVTLEQIRAAVRAHWMGSGERFLSERGIHLPGDLPDLPPMKQQVFDPLAAEFPEARFRFTLARLEGLGYYTGFCLRISPETQDGKRFPVADGGFTNWTARLLQDRKERLLTSGIGAELLCKLYLKQA